MALNPVTGLRIRQHKTEPTQFLANRESTTCHAKNEIYLSVIFKYLSHHQCLQPYA